MLLCMTVNGVNTYHMYVLILPNNTKQETESLALQDFITDPLNPNVEDFLANINQSYEAVIGQYGIQSFTILLLDNDTH